MCNVEEKHYGLEERTYKFAKRVRELVRKISKTVAVIEDGKQVVRSSGSVAANYIEAHEAISKKDELHRLKICRKEAKESRLWLRLMYISDEFIELNDERKALAQEAFELTRIFGSIVHTKEGTRVIKENDVKNEQNEEIKENNESPQQNSEKQLEESELKDNF